MSDSIIYWAVLLTEKGKADLLNMVTPKHQSIYAEHITIVFRPTSEQNDILYSRLGESVTLAAIGISSDDKGQAVVVTGEDRLDDGTAHITVSCAEGIKPFYSNELLGSGWEPIEPFTIDGVIAVYTNTGWVKSK